MISHLEGTVLAKRPLSLVLNVQGVGYKVFCTEHVLHIVSEGEELSLFTHLAVRDDAMDLYGFFTQEELDLFVLLIGVNGIGPRSALGIMGLEHIETLLSAIAQGDVGYLTKVSGVGKKSAEKIVLELKEKVSVFDLSALEEVRRDDEDMLEALKTLGYRADKARDALRQVPKEITEQSDILREALKLLS